MINLRKKVFVFIIVIMAAAIWFGWILNSSIDNIFDTDPTPTPTPTPEITDAPTNKIIPDPIVRPIANIPTVHASIPSPTPIIPNQIINNVTTNVYEDPDPIVIVTSTATPTPTPTPIPVKISMESLKIISPIPSKGLGREYHSSPEVVDDSNYIEIGLVVRNSNGESIKDAQVTVESPDPSQNKTMDGTGNIVKIYNSGIPEMVYYYPYHYEFRSSGVHEITFKCNGMNEMVSLNAI